MEAAGVVDDLGGELGADLGLGALLGAAAGIAVVLARSFARIFFRNAINIGLPVVEVPGHEIQPGARLRVDLIRGEVVDETAGRTYRATRMPPVMADILAAGGLVPYLKGGGDYSVKG